jgi:hypothetical protein
LELADRVKIMESTMKPDITLAQRQVLEDMIAASSMYSLLYVLSEICEEAGKKQECKMAKKWNRLAVQLDRLGSRSHV